MSKYKFNKEQLSFVEDKLGISGKFAVAFRYLLGSILLATLYYIVFALIFNTREEEKIIQQNQLMEQEYKKVTEKMEILDKVILDLKARDQEIYFNLFKSYPPDIFEGHNNSSLYSRIDSASDITLVNLTSLRNSKMEVLTSQQEKKIREILSSLASMSDVMGIPAILPVKNIGPSQTGAGVGRKIHPFYKTPVEHKGLDILSPLGTQVRATADGIVEKVVKSDRGRGNQITIRHESGYKTYYAHLGDILVRESQPVRQGAVIGRVGNSGLSFAPHLHYEVTLNGEVLDPVSFFFAEITPVNFREMKINAVSNGQSLD